MSKPALAALFLVLGLTVGFFAGLGATTAGAAFLQDFVSSEASADVAHPQDYVRPSFSFKFPGNWKTDADDPSNDPDHHLNVESPGSCLTMLLLFDVAVDPAESIQRQIDAFVPKLLSAPLRTPFTTWGKYEGRGVLMKGKMLGVVEGSVRAFAYADEKRSFIAVEQCYDEDMKDAAPGLKLVEASFTLLP